MQLTGILGIKLAQTQKFRTDGKRIPVTVVEVNNNPVVATKTMDRDGYWAVQLGYGIKKHPSKPLTGHMKGANVKAPQFLKEVRLSQVANADELPKVGEFVSLETVLKPGDVIDVTGISKGKGFAGGVKRFHFKGGPRTHGQSDRERAPGSIGQTTTPGRVYKGKRMAGKMGFETVTVRNLTVADVAGNLLYIEGLVPGAPGWLIEIEAKGKEDKRFAPLLKEGANEPKEAEVEAVAEEPAKEEIKVEEPVKEEAPVQEAAAESTEVVEPVKEEKQEEKQEETKEEAAK